MCLTGSVSVRLSRPDATGSKLVCVGRVRTALAAGARWRCLALNVLEHVHKRRIHIQVRPVHTTYILYETF